MNNLLSNPYLQITRRKFTTVTSMNMMKGRKQTDKGTKLHRQLTSYMLTRDGILIPLHEQVHPWNVGVTLVNILYHLPIHLKRIHQGLNKSKSTNFLTSQCRHQLAWSLIYYIEHNRCKLSTAPSPVLSSLQSSTVEYSREQ